MTKYKSLVDRVTVIRRTRPQLGCDEYALLTIPYMTETSVQCYCGFLLVS